MIRVRSSENINDEIRRLKKDVENLARQVAELRALVEKSDR